MGKKKDKFSDLKTMGRNIAEDWKQFGRPDWSHPILLSIVQARCLGIEEISLMEFGVANGEGLEELCRVAEAFSERTEISFRVYGFDRGGLPGPVDYRDHPEIWSQGDYKMKDPDRIRERLPDFCQLIMGDVAETVPPLLETEIFADCPIGFISIDLDFYSSTKDALKIFSGRADLYLPSVQMYFDDTELLITSSEWTGEGLAIKEFNDENEIRKIEKKNIKYNRYYVAHILDHPVRTGQIIPDIPLAFTYCDFWGTSRFWS